MASWDKYLETIRSKVQIKRLTYRLLKDHPNHRSDEELDVKGLVKSLGVRLIEAPAVADAPSLSGAAVMHEGAPVILVNASHGKPRQRFTIAHELGHLLMHIGTGKAVMFRDEISARGVNPFEVEANAFAAALLMPEHRVYHLVPEPLNPLDEDGVTELASKFGVSSQAMAIRLKSLGLLQA